jgi:hypothetical protein
MYMLFPQWLRQEGSDWPDVLNYNGSPWPDTIVAWCRAEGCDSPLYPESEDDDVYDMYGNIADESGDDDTADAAENDSIADNK